MRAKKLKQEPNLQAVDGHRLQTTFTRYRDLTAGGFYSTPHGAKDLRFVGNVASASFDVALNAFSMQYLVRPIEVLREPIRDATPRSL